MVVYGSRRFIRQIKQQVKWYKSSRSLEQARQFAAEVRAAINDLTRLPVRGSLGSNIEGLPDNYYQMQVGEKYHLFYRKKRGVGYLVIFLLRGQSQRTLPANALRKYAEEGELDRSRLGDDEE